MPEDFVIIALANARYTMGKGDKKSKKGKIWKDSYGNSRRKKLIKAKLRRSATKKTTGATPVEEAAAKPKRTQTRKKSDV